MPTLWLKLRLKDWANPSCLKLLIETLPGPAALLDESWSR
jgi:hypothetical protein